MDPHHGGISMRSSILLLLLCATAAQAEVITETVEYQHGNVTCIGYLAYDDAVTGQRPGVLVIHEWWGLNDYAKRRTRMLAELGYIAFAADMYGDGQAVTTSKEASKLAGAVRGDSKIMRGRANAALAVLRRHPRTDTNRLAAIGYCFGGTGVLELARSGANIAGVVSFHGGLGTDAPAQAGDIKAKVLVCHGAADPHVNPAETAALRDEMDGAGADWQMIYYAHAVHAFTNPGAGGDPSQGVAYNAAADRRSWRHMRVFFDEIFADK
jgi:dienelactone hydrolase